MNTRDERRDQIPAYATTQADKLTALEEAASHYRAILETTVDAIIAIDEPRHPKCIRRHVPVKTGMDADGEGAAMNGRGTRLYIVLYICTTEKKDGQRENPHHR